MLRSALLVAALAFAAVLPRHAQADSYQFFVNTYTGTVTASGYDAVDYPNGAYSYTPYNNVSAPATIVLRELAYSSGEIFFFADSVEVDAPGHSYGSPVVDLYLDFDNCADLRSNCVYFNFDPFDYSGPYPAPQLYFNGDLTYDDTDPATGNNYYGDTTFSGDLHLVTATTPEPSTFALLGTGLLGTVGILRRRQGGRVAA